MVFIVAGSLLLTNPKAAGGIQKKAFEAMVKRDSEDFEAMVKKAMTTKMLKRTTYTTSFWSKAVVRRRNLLRRKQGDFSDRLVKRFLWRLMIQGLMVEILKKRWM